MKWYAVAAVALVLLVTYAYYTVCKQAELARVVDDIKLYMAKLETLKRDVATEEELQQRVEALDKAAENLKTKEGELKGKYGDMLALEAECKKLTEKRDGLLAEVKAQEELSLLGQNRLSELASQTNVLAKARDAIHADTEAAMDKQKARVAVARAEADKEVAEQENRKRAAQRDAADASAAAEAAKLQVKTLAAKVVELEAKHGELAGIERQLAEVKASLAVEQEKLGQTRAKMTAQQIAAHIDDIRKDVALRLGEFKVKLEELEKKQNEVKQGGVE